MAEFCQQCSIATFGEDFGEFAGLSFAADTDKGLYAVVLCEGCGPTQVDHIGRCVAPACLCQHGKAEELNNGTS